MANRLVLNLSFRLQQYEEIAAEHCRDPLSLVGDQKHNKRGRGKWARSWCGQSIHCVVASLVDSSSEWMVVGQSSNKGMIVADSVRREYLCTA